MRNVENFAIIIGVVWHSVKWGVCYMKDLTSGNLSKTFLRFAIPAILAGLLGQAYAIIDSIIIGKFLGTESLAALGSTGEFLSLIDAIFWGYGVGCGIYVAKLFSAGDNLKLRNTIIATLLTESLVAVFLEESLHSRQDGEDARLTYHEGGENGPRQDIGRLLG